MYPEQSTYPSLWDSTVAGGQPEGLSLAANMCKEAAEEVCPVAITTAMYLVCTLTVCLSIVTAM